MAEKIIGRKGTINSADSYVIGNVGVSGGSWTIHLEADGSWNGTVRIKARATKPTGASAALTIQQIPYTKLFLNGSVADGTTVNSDITTTSIVQVPIADGLDVVVDCTTFSAGTMAVQAYPSS